LIFHDDDYFVKMMPLFDAPDADDAAAICRYLFHALLTFYDMLPLLFRFDHA